MTFSVRKIATLAIGSLLVAGCGGGDQPPHAVDQTDATASPSGSPNQTGLSGRSPQTLPMSEPGAEAEQEEIARRGFWTGSRRQTAFGEWTMQQTAIDALSRIGQPAVPALVNLLDEPNPQLRAEAVIALARIGPEARGALPQLIGLVEHDPDEGVRKNAVRALGQIGPAAAPAVPTLVEQLRAAIENPAGNEHLDHGSSSGESSTGGGRPAGNTRPHDGP